MRNTIIYLTVGGLLFYAFSQTNLKTENDRPKDASETIQPFALMELFTSEGCSNCPPAYKVVDAVMDKAKRNHEHVMLLDFHVDYFNDPWVDPYSSPQNTQRQENYGKIFPGEGVFTPQMIVNGSEALLASSSIRVEGAVSKALKRTPDSQIIISDAIDKNGKIKVHFTAENIPADSMINIALVQGTAVQKVLSGENAGRTLTHHNVVRAMILAKVKDGTAEIATPTTSNDGAVYSVIAFRQDMGTLKITAASEKDVTD